VVPSLGPRVWEKYKQFGYRYLRWKYGKKILGACVDKMHIGQPRPVLLAVSASDSVGDDIDANAGFIGMCLCVSGEQVSVAAPDFQHAGFHS
jgi:hypothetical protein